MSCLNLKSSSLKGYEPWLKWTPEATTQVKLHTIWLRITGVPDTMKGYFALSEIGSILGVMLEVDMETLRAQDIARMKIIVKDLAKNPIMSEVTATNIFVYMVYFMIESVVEWMDIWK